MKRSILTLAALGAAATLASCGQRTGAKAAEAEAASPAPAMAAAPTAKSGPMSAMPGMADAKMGKGIGKVTAVDAAAGRITLDHEAIPAVGWPAMKMAFKADPTLLKAVKVGDKVAFDLTVKDGAGEVTAIAHP